MTQALDIEPDPIEEKPPPDTYFGLTRTRSYSFLAALPLILLYEVMIVVANEGSFSQVRVGAEVWIKDALAIVGQTGIFILGIGIVLVGCVILYVDRKKGIGIRPNYFPLMIAESTLYAIIVAFLVSTTVGMIFSNGIATVHLALSSGLSDNGLFTNIALSIGAGIYEELVFRVLLVGGMAWAFTAFGLKTTLSYVIAAIIGALVFSAVHYTGSLGDAFTLPSFTFRFLFGLVLNAIFLVRGFGVAAWTHAIYDILIVTGFLG